MTWHNTAVTYASSVSSRMIDDVFYVDYNVCSPDYRLKDICQKLKDALAQGITKVILDARGNSGGNSAANDLLFEAMGMQGPDYGGVIRISAYAKEQYPSAYGDSEIGLYEWEPNPGTAVTNPTIHLIVLTDEVTFSSANMLVVSVQDGNLGQIVERPSSNSPSSFGDILTVELPQTGLSVNISHKRFLRPDTSADQTIVCPDVLVPIGEDSLQTALELLAEES